MNSRSLVLLFLVAMVVAFASMAAAADLMAIDDSIINYVNSPRSKAKWRAGRNKVFEGKTLSQIKPMFSGALLNFNKKIFENARTVDYNVLEKDLPTSYSFNETYPDCAHPVRDQGRCGSCWAFSATCVMADRFCQATKGSKNVILSPQDMVSCDKQDLGCNGGYLDYLWKYFESTGVVSDTCFPYVSGKNGTVPRCPLDSKTCENPVEDFIKYKAMSHSTVHYANVESAMTDLIAHGPFQIGFRVYQDFMSYKSGVYHHVSGGFLGGHAVEILGWGVTADGTKYWSVKNSWTESWGEGGYFRIQRGINECSLESQMYAALPATD